jgi:hypothetical protein
VILNYCRGCICYPSWKIISHMWCSSKMVHLHIVLVSPEKFLTCIFLGAGLGVTDQFRCLRAHLILYRLSSSCEDTLRTLFTRPLLLPLMNWSSELLMRPKQLHRKCWRTLGRKVNSACTSYVPWRVRMLKLCNILQCLFYRLWNVLSYFFIFRKQFYFIFSGLKIIGLGKPDNNVESPSI